MKPTDLEADEFSPMFRDVQFEYTPRFPEILKQESVSILVSTYQAGKVLVLGESDGQLHVTLADFDQPMGLAVSRNRIAIGTRKQIHFLVPAHETQSKQSVYDGCFVPRTSFYTGSVHGHDLAWGRDGLWLVNTLFSCLATLNEDYSFIPRWRPPFISELADQDRCHLNGLAMMDGMPRYVSMMSETDTPAGWRPNKATSGVVMDVASNQVVCRGLSMPHSPRFHGGRLWVLNSGYGALGYVDLQEGRFRQVASVPGYTRGLSFAGNYAFVGLSRIRETSVFGGVPIAEHRNDLQCGVGVIDWTRGETVAVFRFLNGVSEIFAVEALDSFVNPLIAGSMQNKQEQEVWIVPSPSAPIPKPRPTWSLFNVGAVHNPADLSTSGAMSAAEWVEIGNRLQESGEQEKALLSYRNAIDADSKCTAAWQNYAYLLFNLGETDRSCEAFSMLLELDPSPLNRLLASSSLPVVYDSIEDIDYWRNRQMEILQNAVRDGCKVDATKSLVPTSFFPAYQGRCDLELARMRASIIVGKDFTHGRKRIERQDGRRRIGFLSAYFRDHTIGRLNLKRIEHLNPTSIRTVVISAGNHDDPLGSQFANVAGEYVVLPRQLSAAIDMLVKLDLDILLFADVGMDSLTSTLAYSRFAPIQMVTWGHPDTTGSPMLDYFVSSESLESPNGKAHYSERLLLLASLGIDYEDPRRFASQKTRVDFGLGADKRLYGCPQSLFKFHPEFDEILAEILHRDPMAEIVLLNARNNLWSQSLRKRFRRTLAGLDHRIRFLPMMANADYLALLRECDVLLDPLHFGGGNSSIEALAMRTPLVTLPSQYLRGRITSALFQQTGLEELIVDSAQRYADLAISIANQSNLRLQLATRMDAAASRFFGTTRGANELSELLQTVAPVYN